MSVKISMKSIAVRVYRRISKLFRFRNDYEEFSSLSKDKDKRFDLKWKDRYPILGDNTATTSFDAHYIYHPAWAARLIAQNHPKKHIDISSYLPFCSIMSAFIPVTFYDYRPAQLTLEGLSVKSADLVNLEFESNSIESLSCMHTVEHIGLGRYGDPIDPLGDLRAISELTRVLAKNGNLYFVVPVGKPIIRFNAHRIYSFDQIVNCFSSLKLMQFSLVDDNGVFITNADPNYANLQTYGCGCWWFNKENL